MWLKEIKFPARSRAVLAAKTPSPVDEFTARFDAGAQSMIPKSGYRFSEKIMLNQ
jgi:hypothetical protein